MSDEKKTVVVYSERYLDHDTGQHVENSRRLEAIEDSLRGAACADRIAWTAPRAATVADIARVHDRDYIESVEDACRGTIGLSYLNPDTAICRDSYDVALLAAGGVMEGIDRVVGGEARGFFAMVRPPGHHAEQDQSLGFCLFNNIAIGARYAQEAHDIDRVFILDWDVHHGNGTQHSFEEDASIFFTSFHQWPFYPGTGRASETGRGAGRGHTLNFPMPAGTENDDYIHLMTEVVRPAVEKFKPQLVLISAGFDAHRDDLLGGLKLTESCFAGMLDIMMSAAGDACPVGLVLEGGYQLRALGASAAAAVGRLCGAPLPEGANKAEKPSHNAVAMAKTALAEHPYFTK